MLFYNEKIFKRCFDWRGKYWYRNIKEIPLYFKLMHHLIKYGYDEYAEWETFNWFIDTMKPILKSYYNYVGVPIVIENFSSDTHDENVAEWHRILDRMIDLLDMMDECSSRYKDADKQWQYEEMNAAKDEFFELFSKYFYNLWD